MADLALQACGLLAVAAAVFFGLGYTYFRLYVRPALFARIENLRAENETALLALEELTSKAHPVDEAPISWAEEPESEKEMLVQSVQDLRHALEAKNKTIHELGDQIEILATKVDPELLGPDNLEQVNGIGPYIKRMLEQEFGITTFERLAHLSADEIAQISKKLFFHDKIQKENWVAQAEELYEKKYGQKVPQSSTLKRAG